MEKKIFFKNSKGNNLCGILSNPTNNINNPVIILCHGFTTSKDNKTNKTLQKILNKKNISIFRFDFFGHGESEGKFENITISEAVDDILNAIKYLKNNNYKKIGLVGSSFGGISCINAASKTKDLFLLGLKAPVSNYLEKEIQKRSKEEIELWKNKGYIIHINSKGKKKKLNYTFFENFINNNGYKAAKNIKIPTLIVHGDKDKSVPIEQSIKTSKIIKNCDLEIIEKAGHLFDKNNEFKKMIKLISDFIINKC